MKYLYFGDLMGDLKEERDEIQKTLRQVISKKIKIVITETPPFGDEKDYDVLFFDWGGMSIGNRLMESFCRQIVEEARERPNKLYIMTSSFTKEAMKEAQHELKLENETFNNIFLDLKNAIPLIKAWEKK